MSKKKNVKQADKNLEGIEQALTRSERFIEENQKLLSYLLVALMVIAGAVILVNRRYIKPKNEEASAEMFYAERYFEIDSFNLALNGYGTFPGFLQIMDDYGMTRSAKVARYYAGVCYHQRGNHEEAINYLNKFKTKDLLVGAAQYSTLGDAYLEMGDLGKAASAYKKGLSSYKNSFTSPILLKKLGLVYEEMEKLELALETYETIELDFPASTEGREIRKYIGRVEAKLAL